MYGEVVGSGSPQFICGHKSLRRRLVSESYEYGENGETVIVEARDVPLEDCLSCGQTFSGPEAARIRHEAIVGNWDCYIRQMRALRERVGVSLDEFSKLIGVRTAVLNQWEDGTLCQDLSTDRLMRLLGTDDELDPLEIIAPTYSNCRGSGDGGPGFGNCERSGPERSHSVGWRRRWMVQAHDRVIPRAAIRGRRSISWRRSLQSQGPQARSARPQQNERSGLGIARGRER